MGYLLRVTLSRVLLFEFLENKSKVIGSLNFSRTSCASELAPIATDKLIADLGVILYE